MPNNARVLIVEDDFYARHWMEMLLRRDWRTRVVKQVGSPVDLVGALSDLDKHNRKVDVVLIDTDIPLDDSWLTDVLKKLSDFNAGQIEEHKAKKQRYTPPVLLFTGVNPNYRISNLASTPSFGGYILKDEIRYSLAWAVTFTGKGRKVITPGVQNLFTGSNSLPKGSMILDGRKPLPLSKLTERELEAARLAFMFSMERHELANELMIAEDYSYGLVGSLFEKVGLNDVLDGTVSPGELFGDHPAVKKHIDNAIKAYQQAAQSDDPNTKKKNIKIKYKETLAFHLLTLPHFDEIY